MSRSQKWIDDDENQIAIVKSVVLLCSKPSQTQIHRSRNIVQIVDLSYWCNIVINNNTNTRSRWHEMKNYTSKLEHNQKISLLFIRILTHPLFFRYKIYFWEFRVIFCSWFINGDISLASWSFLLLLGQSLIESGEARAYEAFWSGGVLGLNRCKTKASEV